MDYKAVTEHAQAVGGVTGLARLTERVKQSSLDVDAVCWNCNDFYPGALFVHITAWTKNEISIAPLLSVVIMRLQPVTDDAT
jgi:hypothetical protein